MCVRPPPQVPDLFKQGEEPSPFPLEFLRKHAEKSGKGAHSSDIPSKNAPFHVGVSRNPHADQPSFLPQGNGGPPVQVLAKSGKPPGSFGGADHPKTPSSIALGSDNSKVGTDLSASLPPPNLFGTKGKPVRPLHPIPRSPLGGDIGGIEGNSAAPLSSKLGSSATSSVPQHLRNKPLPKLPNSNNSSSTAAVQSRPLGQDIGGMKHNEKMLDISSLILLGAHLRHIGVPSEQAPLFSHIPPALLAQAVEVA